MNHSTVGDNGTAKAFGSVLLAVCLGSAALLASVQDAAAAGQTPDIFGTWIGTLSLQVIFLPVQEHDQIGILFKRSGVAKVGHRGALVIPALQRSTELCKSNKRNI